LQFILNKIKSLFSYTYRKFFRFLFSLFFLSVTLILLIVSYLTYISQELPSIEALQNYKPVQVAKIISADGKPLKDLYIDQKRDVVEIGIETTKIGITSITFKCEARVKGSEKAIIQIDEIVFVNLNENGVPFPHNKSKL